MIPVIRMDAENNVVKDPHFYSCPIYKKPLRTDFIAAVDLTAQLPECWILQVLLLEGDQRLMLVLLCRGKDMNEVFEGQGLHGGAPFCTPGF
ncbi:dynein axonemal heavy chain 5-like [Neoarius graeffei]|uniref:dynein axonemal heavy chain 5-like n=1 Tax=Neoarius graeffei TaxID=443677 RepID=UPI00298C5EF9|nr:dynein axonemal heavy chain 5-like [Neoarius graeffei]